MPLKEVRHVKIKTSSSFSLSFKLWPLCMSMILVIVSLANNGYLIIVGFIYNKLTLTILYCVVGACDDREPSFVGVDGQ